MLEYFFSHFELAHEGGAFAFVLNPDAKVIEAFAGLVDGGECLADVSIFLYFF